MYNKKKIKIKFTPNRNSIEEQGNGSGILLNGSSKEMNFRFNFASKHDLRTTSRCARRDKSPKFDFLTKNKRELGKRPYNFNNIYYSRYQNLTLEPARIEVPLKL